MIFRKILKNFNLKQASQGQSDFLSPLGPSPQHHDQPTAFSVIKGSQIISDPGCCNNNLSASIKKDTVILLETFTYYK